MYVLQCCELCHSSDWNGREKLCVADQDDGLWTTADHCRYRCRRTVCKWCLIWTAFCDVNETLRSKTKMISRLIDCQSEKTETCQNLILGATRLRPSHVFLRLSQRSFKIGPKTKTSRPRPHTCCSPTAVSYLCYCSACLFLCNL